MSMEPLPDGWDDDLDEDQDAGGVDPADDGGPGVEPGGDLPAAQDPPAPPISLEVDFAEKVQLTADIERMTARLTELTEDPGIDPTDVDRLQERMRLERQIEAAETALPYVGMDADALTARAHELELELEDRAIEIRRLKDEGREVRAADAERDRMALAMSVDQLEAERLRRSMDEYAIARARELAEKKVTREIHAEDKARITAVRGDPKASRYMLAQAEADAKVELTERHDWEERVSAEAAANLQTFRDPLAEWERPTAYEVPTTNPSALLQGREIAEISLDDGSIKMIGAEDA